MVHEAFSMEFENLINEIKSRKEAWSRGTRDIYNEIAGSEHGLKAIDIAKKISKAENEEVLAAFSDRVQFSLDELCDYRTTTTGAEPPGINYCRKLEGGIYFIHEAEIAHALKLELRGKDK
jgi:hypothetical protein